MDNVSPCVTASEKWAPFLHWIKWKIPKNGICASLVEGQFRQNWLDAMDSRRKEGREPLDYMVPFRDEAATRQFFQGECRHQKVDPETVSKSDEDYFVSSIAFFKQLVEEDKRKQEEKKKKEDEATYYFDCQDSDL